MAEMTEAEIITKINLIDTAIATITTNLAAGGSGAVEYVDYSMGSKTVAGSQTLKQLMEARKLYEDLLRKIPSVTMRDHGYSVKDGSGENETEYVGDE